MRDGQHNNGLICYVFFFLLFSSSLASYIQILSGKPNATNYYLFVLFARFLLLNCFTVVIVRARICLRVCAKAKKNCHVSLRVIFLIFFLCENLKRNLLACIINLCVLIVSVCLLKKKKPSYNTNGNM